MAIPVPYAFSGASRLSPRASAPVLLVAIALCGCSFDLGSWSSAPDKETVPKAAPAEAEVSDAQAATQRGQALVRSGKTEEARAEFDHAVALDPYNAQALYSRGLLHQSEQQHQLAIDALPASAASPARTTTRSRAFSSEVDTGSRKENASKQAGAWVLIQSEPIRL